MCGSSPRSEYHQYRQARVPLRWLPAEAVFEDDYSTKTDVWAFAVLVWEVFSFGELPYAPLDDDKVLEGEGYTSSHLSSAQASLSCTQFTVIQSNRWQAGQKTELLAFIFDTKSI